MVQPLRSRLHQLGRYAGASAVATTTSLVTLGLLVGVGGVPALWANLAATGVGTGPSFELNRRWVWRVDGRPSLRRQVVPFCVLSFAGLALSSLTVHLAAGLTAHRSAGVRTAAVESASVAAYGLLWAVQFVLLDRVLFARRAPAPVPTPLAAPPTAVDDAARAA